LFATCCLNLFHVGLNFEWINSPHCSANLDKPQLWYSTKGCTWHKSMCTFQLIESFFPRTPAISWADKKEFLNFRKACWYPISSVLPKQESFTTLKSFKHWTIGTRSGYSGKKTLQTPTHQHTLVSGLSYSHPNPYLDIFSVVHHYFSKNYQILAKDPLINIPVVATIPIRICNSGGGTKCWISVSGSSPR